MRIENGIPVRESHKYDTPTTQYYEAKKALEHLDNRKFDSNFLPRSLWTRFLLTIKGWFGNKVNTVKPLRYPSYAEHDKYFHELYQDFKQKVDDRRSERTKSFNAAIKDQVSKSKPSGTELV